MKRIFNVIIVLISILLFSSCQQKDGWKSLFNGQDLENWDKYLGSSLGAEFDSLAREATVEKVFTIVDLDGEKVIRISGEINGSLATRESFENYHLRLVFKWGETVYSRRNSGLLYHSFGDFGAAFGTWMPNIELQLMHQNLGDNYLMVNCTSENPVIVNPENNQFIFNAGGEKLSFGEHASGRMIRKSHDMELPLGEWNVVDLYCFGTTAIHVVNGETVMVNYNTGVFENGVVNPLSAGKIQLQSEGAELLVKSIDIRNIKVLPGGLIPSHSAL
jgi:hypothetical protein